MEEDREEDIEEASREKRLPQFSHFQTYFNFLIAMVNCRVFFPVFGQSKKINNFRESKRYSAV